MPKRIGSRTKGVRGERELARLLTEAGFDAERAQQYKGGQHSEDIYCPELNQLGLHIECKRVNVIRLDRWLDQIEKDAGPDKLPVIFWRRDRGPWITLMLASDYLDLVAHLMGKRG